MAPWNRWTQSTRIDSSSREYGLIPMIIITGAQSKTELTAMEMWDSAITASAPLKGTIANANQMTGTHRDKLGTCAMIITGMTVMETTSMERQTGAMIK